VSEEHSSDDAKLIAAAAAGDAEAFAALVRRHGPRLFSFLYQITGQAADAEDIGQTAWLSAHAGLGRFDVRRPFRPWLFAIAHRAAISAWRRRRPADPLQDCDWVDAAHPAAALNAREDADALWAWVARVVNRDAAEALWLMYQEELSVAEIARTLGCSVVRVKVMLHRARRKLQRAAPLPGALGLSVAGGKLS
jgi:RNA polymerase sigma-70 factor, ECF subfamily